MSDDVRVLTLHQPYASLVAVGAKTIVDQARPTEYRGRLLIHAAKAVEYEAIGPYYCERWWARDDLRHVDECECSRDGVDPRCGDRSRSSWCLTYGGNEVVTQLPLGAVVASCVLTDCVPTDTIEWCDEPSADRDAPWVRVAGTDYGEFPAFASVRHGELPFGDFTPGRYAWLLGDVQPTTARCPRCWGGPTAGAQSAPPDCVCRGAGLCGPVPMRGRQGLTAPKWAA